MIFLFASITIKRQRKLMTADADKYARKGEHLLNVIGSTSCYNSCRKQFGSSSRYSYTILGLSSKGLYSTEIYAHHFHCCFSNNRQKLETAKMFISCLLDNENVFHLNKVIFSAVKKKMNLLNFHVNWWK